ncbi:MAG: hypothetical protein HY716_07850 [Planctomycetes bacterium]|nr:hypothetical protein [Planctomycetota bacterium]
MELKRGAKADDAIWNLWYLDVVQEDSGFLSSRQHDYLVEQFKDMARYKDPALCPTVDVRKVEDYYALHDKGGILGKTNVRVYFSVEPKHKAIVTLCTYKKEEEAQMPKHLKIRIANRIERARALLAVAMARERR